MSEPVYDSNDKLVGHLVKGKVVSLPPIPTGEGYDELLDNCLTAVFKHPRVKVDPQVSHPCWLRERIEDAIQVGTLRDLAQWRDAVNRLQNTLEREYRLDTRKDTRFSLGEFWRLAEAFGVQHPESNYKPPTPEKLAADREAVRKEQEALQAVNDELDVKYRTRDLIKKIGLAAIPASDFDTSGENLPPEYWEWQEKLRAFRDAIADAVAVSVRSGMTDTEILSQFKEGA
jgi:hypothetical protein